MGKIKVLHLIKTLNLGGAETNLLNLIQAIDSEKFEIHIGYSFGGEIEKKFKESEIKLFKFARGYHKVKSISSIVILFRLVKYIIRNKIQIVHTHNFSAHVWGTIAAKITGRKIVEHVHDFRYLDPEEFKIRRGINKQYKYIKYFKNMSDIVIVLTKQNKEYLIQRKIYPEFKVREIQNGIPLYEVRRNELNSTRNGFTILTSARLSPEKNLDLVLRIVPRIIREVKNTIFIICGDGPLLKEFKLKIKNTKLENNIKFIGYSPNINDLLEMSDIFLLPSFLELHSIAILEAMSKKVPVVVSKEVGCNNEFINNWSNGVLLDPFFDEQWTEAIIKLLNNPKLRIEIGQKGYETCIEKYDIKKVANKIEDIYVELNTY